MIIQSLEKDLEQILKEDYSENIIYEKLCKYDPNSDIDNVIIIIIDNFLLSKENLKILIKKLEMIGSHIEMIKKAIIYEGKMQTQMFIQKILQIYNKNLSDSEVDYLIRYTEDCEYNFNLQLSDVKTYLNYYVTSKKYAKKPSWVSRKEGENISLLKTVSSGAPLAEIYQGEKVRNIMRENSSLIKSLSINDQKIENVEEAIVSFLSTLSKTKDAKEIDEPSRIFGPPNAFQNRLCATGPGGLGPCRMLECGCLLDEDEDQTDWFSGNCDQCNNIIVDRSHSVRFPRKEGGWEGCFCCIQCIIDKYNIEEDNDIENLDKSMFRIQLLKNTLEKNGIMDRH